MKIKATIYELREVEIETEFPAFYKGAISGDYYAIFSEELRVNVFEGSNGYKSVIVNGNESTFFKNMQESKPCTREEFFEALNSVLSEVKRLEEATEIQTTKP